LNDYKVQKANLKKKSIPAGCCPAGAAACRPVPAAAQCPKFQRRQNGGIKAVLARIKRNAKKRN